MCHIGGTFLLQMGSWLNMKVPLRKGMRCNSEEGHRTMIYRLVRHMGKDYLTKVGTAGHVNKQGGPGHMTKQGGHMTKQGGPGPFLLLQQTAVSQIGPQPQ